MRTAQDDCCLLRLDKSSEASLDKLVLSGTQKLKNTTKTLPPFMNGPRNFKKDLKEYCLLRESNSYLRITTAELVVICLI